MSEPTVLEIDQNADGAWQVTAQDSDGNPVVFSPSDALECIVWQGDTSSALLSPSVSWISAPDGTIQVAVSAAQTASLAAGTYPLELTAIPASSGQRLRVLNAWLAVAASPGTETLPPVYGTYQDLVDYGGGTWIETLRQESGLANFVKQQGRARSWLDQLIVRKFRPWAGRTIHWSETTIVGPPDARNPIIRDYLASNFLMLTDAMLEIIALKTLELICRQQAAMEPGDVWSKREAKFRGECNRLVLKTPAEIDTDGDGLADYAFNLATVNIR